MPLQLSAETLRELRARALVREMAMAAVSLACRLACSAIDEEESEFAMEDADWDPEPEPLLLDSHRLSPARAAGTRDAARRGQL